MFFVVPVGEFGEIGERGVHLLGNVGIVLEGGEGGSIILIAQMVEISFNFLFL